MNLHSKLKDHLELLKHHNEIHIEQKELGMKEAEAATRCSIKNVFLKSPQNSQENTSASY